MIRRFMFLLVLPLVACGQNRTLDEEVELLYRKTVPIIHATALDSLLKADSTVIILDCREAEEFDVSHLVGARFAAYSSFDSQELQLNNEDVPIVVYCSIGYRSERIGEKLQDAGYTKVYNLYGGIFDWKNNGGIVVASENDTTEKVHTYNKQWSRYLEAGEKVY